MEQIEDIITQQFEGLVDEGQELLRLAISSTSGLQGDQLVRLASWVSRSGQIIKNVCKDDSIYYERFAYIIKEKDIYYVHSEFYDHLAIALGCVQAVYNDLQRGLLHDIQNLLRAEIFGDFLEMAEYLLNEGYKDAAAVINGAVLEDTLRKLAIQNGLTVEKADGSSKTIEPLNQELAKSGVYDKLIQKQVTSWADLRNKAAHGNFDKYDDGMVQQMLLFVQKFCSDYLQ